MCSFSVSKMLSKPHLQRENTATSESHASLTTIRPHHSLCQSRSPKLGPRTCQTSIGAHPDEPAEARRPYGVEIIT